MPHTYQFGALVVTVPTLEDFEAHGRACNEPGVTGLAARIETALNLSADKHVRVTVHNASLVDAEFVATAYCAAGWEAWSVPDSKWGSYIEVCPPNNGYRAGYPPDEHGAFNDMPEGGTGDDDGQA